MTRLGALTLGGGLVTLRRDGTRDTVAPLGTAAELAVLVREHYGPGARLVGRGLTTIDVVRATCARMEG